ncbi:MAG: signal peptidase I [Actinobacteria bacterium]|nr:signal peptidase I [Actinomycetota bacterium]
MSWRASAPALALAVALLILSAAAGSVWGALTARTVNAGSTIVAAADWVAPQTTMLDPGTPLRAAVSLNATATDPGGTMSSVTIQRSVAGAGAWSAVCTDSTPPYSCPLDSTTLADGAYDLRAVARDVAANTTTSNTVAARIVDNNGPSVALNPTASDVRGVIALNATATDAGSGIASVRVDRSLADRDSWSLLCTDTSSPYACTLDTQTLASDLYDFRAVAQDLAGNSTTSALLTAIQIDNDAPTDVAITAPASPLRGAVTLSATADDPDSGVASVTLQRSKAGLGAYTDICTTSSYPYSCTFITTAGATPDASYDLRAIATDAAASSTTSALLTRQIDNSQPSVSLIDPGAFLRSTVTVQANAFAGSGITQVAIQRSAASTNTYTTICADTTSPYSCDWDTTATPGGLYDLQAIMTYASGQTLTSAVISDRRVDNSIVTGYDVQAENKPGGRAGKIETGDALILTWSRPMNTTTLLPAWNATTTAPLTARLADGNTSAINTGSGSDALQLLDLTGNATGLGNVNLKANLIKAKKTAAFAASATHNTVTINGIDRTVVRITLGAITNGAQNMRSTTTTPTMLWTPSANARDLSNIASSPAPTNELGTTDRDF